MPSCTNSIVNCKTCIFSLAHHQIVLVAYIAVLGYLATRALRQVPRGTSAGSLPGGLLDTRIVYNTKTGTCQPPLPAELIDTPDGSFDV